MATHSLLQQASKQNFYIRTRCAIRTSRVTRKDIRRSIGMKYLAKVAQSKEYWEEQSKVIRDGKQKSMLSILEERGLVDKIAGDRNALNNLMIDKRIGAYVGIDPTASSLHIGHLLPLMALFWMYVHGYHTVSLLGGATAKIGDPTDRLKTREKEEAHTRTARVVKMHYQLKKIWLNIETYGRKYGYNWEWAWHRELVNNNIWLNKLNIVEFLQLLGPGMRMGAMLARDSVKNKMTKGDGMSFAEFSYPLLQAWDWWHMYNTKGIQMQIGGADQYGNIITGINAVSYIADNHPNPDISNLRKGRFTAPVGFTVPLLTTASGEKFGKSVGNAIWLDSELTSSFELYGFFMRQSDEDVGRYLRLFTFIPLEKIDAVLKKHMKEPKLRKAQHLLAREFLEIVHGAEEAKNAETQHRLLFSKSPNFDAAAARLEKEMKSDKQKQVDFITLNNAPNQNITLPRSLICNGGIMNVLYAADLALSLSRCHRQILQGSLYVAGIPGQGLARLESELTYTTIKPWPAGELAKYLIDDKLLVLRRGKHHIKIVTVVSDEEWEASGNKYTGEEEAEMRNKQRESTLETVAPETRSVKEMARLRKWQR